MTVARWRSWLALLALVMLAGCAAPVRTPAPPDVKVWVGRLSLNVAERPGDSFSGGFELKGAPETGELTLYTPLGGVAARLAWTPGEATLRSGNEERKFPSLEALVRDATGSPLPVTALFDWLEGRATEIAGWEADVSQLAQGRLRARRNAPPPVAELRVALER